MSNECQCDNFGNIFAHKFSGMNINSVYLPFSVFNVTPLMATLFQSINRQAPIMMRSTSNQMMSTHMNMYEVKINMHDTTLSNYSVCISALRITLCVCVHVGHMCAYIIMCMCV